MQPARVTETKFIKGWYRISGAEFFGNVKHETRGEHAGKWVADLHRSNGGFVQYAGIWSTKREAAGEVEFLIRCREQVPA